ncbi:MAG: alanine--tRNA ligase-related protein, partial [Ginsengibacter sp.]
IDLINAVFEFAKSKISFLDNNETFLDTSKITINSILIEFINSNDETKTLLIGDDKFYMRTLSGYFCFVLNDRYGFPFDLTRLIANENGFSVDEAGFEKEMLQQKNRSRSANIIDIEDWKIISNSPNTLRRSGQDEYTNRSKIRTSINKYRKIIRQSEELGQIVLEETPFYAESGGQVGDTGIIKFKNQTIKVIDTKKENNLIIHFTDRLPSKDLLKYNSLVTAEIDNHRRRKIAIHHTATHLLHAALRQVLGTHLTQKGSLVNDEYLRFDFSHFSKMTDEEIVKVESIVNEKIRKSIPVKIKRMKKNEAIEMGAMALFSEKYGEIVRVVIIEPNYSIELCGGTHVKNTIKLGFFKIKHETALGTGIRRIEAVASKAAEDYVNQQLHELHKVKSVLQNTKEIVTSIKELIIDREQLRKIKEQLERLQAHATLNRIAIKKQTINTIDFYHDIIIDVDINVLKKIFSELEIKNSEEPKSVALLISKKDNKTNVLLGCSEIFTEFDSNKIIKEIIAPIINGKGGGQKTLSTAVGQDPSRLNEVIEKVKSLL